MARYCTECGGRVAMTPEVWQCINPSCKETWDRCSEDSEDEGDETEPPVDDRVPEHVRLERREKRRAEQARAYRRRQGLER